MTVSTALAAALLASPPSPSTPDPVIAYEVSATGCRGGRSFNGTGFVVDNWHKCAGQHCTKRLLVTSLHVIHRCSEVTVQPQLCNQDNYTLEQIDAMGWRSPANHPVATWLRYDLAVLPLPDDALVEAASGQLAYEYTPRQTAELELRARRQHQGCPTTKVDVVDTRLLELFVATMYQVGTISSKAGLIGKPKSDHRKEIQGVKVILHRKGGSEPGASGGALWDPEHQRIIGIHQAGLSSTGGAVDGWAIQIPSEEELRNSCLDLESTKPCALLGRGQEATWDDPWFNSKTLESFAKKDWIPPPLRDGGVVMGIEGGWQPIYSAQLRRLELENWALRMRVFFELVDFGQYSLHSYGVDTALTYRSTAHSIVYIAPTGVEVDSSSHRLHTVFLEFMPVQFRLYRRHGRAGFNLGLGGRAGLELPDGNGKREGLVSMFKPGLLARAQARLYVTPRSSLVFSAEYSPEFLGNTSLYAFEGVFPNTKVTPLDSPAFAGHAFGLSLSLEFWIMGRGA